MSNPGIIAAVQYGLPQLSEGMKDRSHMYKWIDFDSIEKGSIVMNDGQKIFFDNNTLPEHIHETMDIWHRITVERD